MTLKLELVAFLNKGTTSGEQVAKPTVFFFGDGLFFSPCICSVSLYLVWSVL